MRQAGRSLPEYRAVRAGTSMLQACRTPDLVTEITLQPVRRHGVDAAIFFSDIVVPLVAVGLDIEIVPGTGPVVAAADPHRGRPGSGPAAGPGAAARHRPVRPASWWPSLAGVPLIGFAGAPYTLASYLIEGGPSKDHARTKALMHSAPALWHGLLGRLAAISATFLQVQIEAGAAAVQLFDSWAGGLSAADYAEFVLPHSSAVFAELADFDVPKIHFGVGTGELLDLMRGAGASRGRAWTGVPRWTWPPPGSAAAPRCRATWIRPCCWPTGRWSRRRCAGSWPRAAGLRGTSSTSGTACRRTPTRTC